MTKGIDQLIKEQKDKIKNLDYLMLTENHSEYKKELIELIKIQGIHITQLKMKKREFWDEVGLDIKH